MKVRIAVVQFKITHLDRAKNFTRIEGFVKRAVKRGADVVVFPEDCVTGSIFGDLTKLDRGQENLQIFRQIAKTYGIDIVTGSSMEAATDGNFNTSYYVQADGEVLGTYRKNHLYPSENSFLTPGVDAPVFDTKFGRVGIVICWDMLFPEIFQRMRDQGVQIIYCPSYWYREIAESLAEHNRFSEEELLDALCLTRAVEANAVVVYCNAAGTMHNPNGSKDTLIGHSQVALPMLGKIKRLNHHRESLVMVDVETDLLEKTRVIYEMNA